MAVQHLAEAGERKRAAGDMYSYKPGAKDIYKLMEEVSVRNTIYGGVDGEAEEKDISDVAGTSKGVSRVFTCESPLFNWRATYREVSLGTIRPVLRVSTSTM